MTLVLDASATLAQVHVEERTPEINRVFELVKAEGAWVPSLWRLEVANVLEQGVRKGRQTAAFRDQAIALLDSLPIEVDTETDTWAWKATLALAVRRRLTLYDACYLELAIRLELPLATLDRELRFAAGVENVRLLGQ